MKNPTDKLVLGTANFARVYNGVLVPDTKAIFDYCKEVGIKFVDTAVAYASEDKIPNEECFSIISKLPAIERHTYKRVERVFYFSLVRLQRSKIYAYLLHRASDYNTMAWKMLKLFKERGLIQKAGMSIYEPAEIQNVDLIQCPYKKFKSYLPTLKAIGISIHVRGVFHDDCYEEALLDENVDYVVIGVENLEQLRQNVERARKLNTVL